MKRIQKINDQVSRYNGLVAKWKSSGGGGKTPPELVEVMEDLYIALDTYLKKAERTVVEL